MIANILYFIHMQILTGQYLNIPNILRISNDSRDGLQVQVQFARTSLTPPMEETIPEEDINTQLSKFLAQMESQSDLSWGIKTAIIDPNIWTKIRGLINCLEESLRVIQAQRYQLRKYKGIFSKEIESRQATPDTMESIQSTLRNLCQDRVYQEVLEKRSILLQENQRLKIENQALKNVLKQSRLQQEKQIANILAKLNQDIKKKLQLLSHQQGTNSFQSAEEKRKMQDTIAQLKKQLTLMVQNKDSLRKEHASAERQVSLLKDQLKTCQKHLQQYQNKCSRLKNQLQEYKQKEQSRKQQYLINFFNRQMGNATKMKQKLQTQAEVCNYLKLIDRAVLSTSQILEEAPSIKQFLVSSIEQYSNKSIQKTTLLFKFDQYHKAFGNYLKNFQLPFLLLLRLPNKRVCGGFYPGLQLRQPSFLFTFLEKGRVFGYSQQMPIQKGCMYANNCLSFGDAELMIKNNADGQFHLNLNRFGPKYFQIARAKDFYEGDSSQNAVKFEEMEIHSIIW